VATLYAQTGESWLAAEVETVFRVACRLTGDPHDAEDLVQDVCERALTRAPPFATAEDCRRWLLRVLFNRFVDGRRHRQRSPIVAVAGAEVVDAAGGGPDADPEAMAVRADAESSLARAWSRLEPDQQMLLLLRAEGHDLGAIAAITDVERPALSSRLHRARSSLARYLEEERSAEPFCAVPENVR